MKLIDKDALLAEIERLRKNQRLDDRHGQGVLDGLHAIERFIDTLEAKKLDYECEKCSLKDRCNRLEAICSIFKSESGSYHFVKEE